MQKASIICTVLVLLMPLFPDVTEANENAYGCTVQVASVLSTQGVVEKRTAETSVWEPVRINTVYCAGDALRTQRNSRAALQLSNDTIIRLDQNSTIILTPEIDQQPFLIRLIQGTLNYFSIKPRSLKIETPYVNGAVEGTEFSLTVASGYTTISVYEGQVQTYNTAGSILVESGYSAATEKDKSPLKSPLINKINSIQWALHYPPLFNGQWNTSTDAVIKKATDYFYRNDLTSSIHLLEQNDTSGNSSNYHKTLASLYLMVGRVPEAEYELNRASEKQSSDSDILAIRSIIALTKGSQKEAKKLALKALTINPASPTALVAMSYIQQASFDLAGANSSIEKAISLQPEDGLLLARQAELLQSIDSRTTKAVSLAKRAVERAPYLAYPYTVLGFLYLNRQEIDLAKTAFQHSVNHDQAAPLPRLGLALVEIYNGNLLEGINLLSLAVTLAPNNSLIRSYLGKAYFDDKEYSLSSQQLEIAKDLDPNDPTPFYYSAIQSIKQNNPGQALTEFQQSIELNDNRAIFRSRLMLDDDLAARSAGAGRLFNQLGFDQIALRYGAKALESSPADYSSHRLLADSYLFQPRHEIARVSELLQAQLLQPENIVPLQPQLTETNLQMLSGSGPTTASFYEFNSLFQQNKTGLLLNSVAGGNKTIGNDLVASTVHDKLSLSFGQYFYSSDGFRENNDLEQKLYNIFAQYRFSHRTHLTGEFRYNEMESGDLKILFDPTFYNPNQRHEDEKRSFRLGGRHILGTGSEIIATLAKQDRDEHFSINDQFGSFIIKENTKGWNGELQHILSKEKYSTRVGASHFDSELLQTKELDNLFLAIPAEVNFNHSSLYGYGYVPILSSVNITAALNYTDVDNGRNRIQQDSFSPKLGLAWQPLKDTTLRAAWIKGVARLLISDQTIEPTQIAGFNQFYDDVPGTESEVWAVGLDQEISTKMYAGVSYSDRNLDVPYPSRSVVFGENSVQIENTDWREQTTRAYLYYLPIQTVSFALEYQYEYLERSPDFYDENYFEDLKTHETKFTIGWFHPSGFRAGISSSYINQQGTFVDPQSFSYLTHSDSDSFWLSAAPLSYLLPKWYGMLSLDIKNIFNTELEFQDTTPENPQYSQERLFLVKFSCKF